MFQLNTSPIKQSKKNVCWNINFYHSFIPCQNKYRIRFSLRMHQTTESPSLHIHTPITSTITHAVLFPFFYGTPISHTLSHFLWIKNENKGLVQHHNKNASQLINVQCKKLTFIKKFKVRAHIFFFQFQTHHQIP